MRGLKTCFLEDFFFLLIFLRVGRSKCLDMSAVH